jgi:hypothetical protein
MPGVTVPWSNNNASGKFITVTQLSSGGMLGTNFHLGKVEQLQGLCQTMERALGG